MSQDYGDQIHRLGEELRSDFRFLELVMRQHFAETSSRFGKMGEQMNESAQQMAALAKRMDGFGSELRSLTANSDERWNQLVGRARLMESRFTTILGAVDREDVRRYCEKLDERLREVERRLDLDPPAA